MPSKKKIVRKKTSRQAYEAKTAAVSVRIEPITRFALELLARIERRSMSAVIEDSVEKKADATLVPGYGPFDGEGFRDVPTIKQLAQVVYSPNSLERIIMLGVFARNLLDYEEARQFEVVRRTPEFWKPEEFARRRFDAPDGVNWPLIEQHLVSLQILIQEAADQPVIEPVPVDQLEELGIKPSDLRLPF